MKNIAILGSTGSIGTQTLEVVREHPDELKVSALAAGSNKDLLKKQIEEFRPKLVSLADEGKALELKNELKVIFDIEDFSIIEINKGSLQVIVSLQYILKKMFFPHYMHIQKKII